MISKKLLPIIEQKKLELDSYRPLPPELVKNLDAWFTVELTYTSNALADNTLTKLETGVVIESNRVADGKTIREHLEAVCHAEAVGYVRQLATHKTGAITVDDILTIHDIILRGIDRTNAGSWRNAGVLKIPELMNTFVDWLSASSESIPLVSADAHYKLVAIHPFIDGNGRTARLLMNLILMQAGYPPAVIRKEERMAYLDALGLIDTHNNYEPFYELICRAIEKSLDIYLDAAKQTIK